MTNKPKRTRGPNRTEAERAIIFAGCACNLSRFMINGMLFVLGARPIPQKSYEKVLKVYVPAFDKVPELLHRNIKHPMTMAQIKKEACI
jgi:hypothetical protein